MCGIAGKVVFDRDDQVSRDVVVAMTGALAHRGPDGSGFHFTRRAGLGHRRLDTAGHGRERQPLGNHAETVWATLDGEIDNAAELRGQLQRRGRVFCTTSSAELLVQGYEQWGDQVVERLRGAFAFALWDEQHSRLLLGRDRLGVRPLCYSLLDGRGFVFASELRALLEDPHVSRDWNRAAVREYLALGYVPSPGTIFCRIAKLSPGHLLTLEHGRIRVRPYACASAAAEESHSDHEYATRLADLLAEVVQTQAASARAFSVLLPPRAPAAALAATLADKAESTIAATTVGFDRLPMTEVPRARALAKRLGVEHHVELVRPQLVDLFPRLAWYFEEPFADPSVITTYYVMAAARAHAPVALGAAGSNDVWAGARGGAEQIHARLRQWLAGARIRRLCSRDFLRDTAGIDPLSSVKQAGTESAAGDDLALATDGRTRLVDSVLTRLDRMSAAAALRLQLPLLDPRVVAFAATVPAKLKAHSGQPHLMFKRLLEGRVPPALLEPDRHPFEAEPGAWLRGPLAAMASDVLFSGRFRQRGLFDVRSVTRTWQAHLTGRRDYHRELWSLLALELWFERVVDGGESRLRAA